MGKQLATARWLPHHLVAKGVRIERDQDKRLLPGEISLPAMRQRNGRARWVGRFCRPILGLSASSEGTPFSMTTARFCRSRCQQAPGR